MKNVIVVGGGASGLVAAIYAAKGGNNVTIIERNNTPLKKLLITGNGKCNYFNENMDLSHYHSSNKENLENIINAKNIKEILEFFGSIGIIPKIKNGYYYPCSNMALSIKNALLKEAELYSIKIINNLLITEIKKENKFIIKGDKESIEADAIILATGGMAAPKTGSDGNGYKLAQRFNHSVIKPFPSLVKLKGKGNYFKAWDKVRCEAILSLYENNQFIKEEKGELQLTDEGISGVCAFNLSTYIARGLEKKKEEKVLINFVPFFNCTSISEVLSFLEKRSEVVTGRTVEELLESVLNYKVLKVLLDTAGINPLKYYDELNKKEKYSLAENLFAFPLIINNVGTFEEAQVSSGGIPLSEIDTQNMESKKTEDLYLIGELLDVNGDCGGYNLAFAFITGMLAGKDIK